MKIGKDLSYYKSLHYKMVISYDKDEEVYVVRFPHLPGCIMHGETAEEAARLGLQVKDEWLELAFRKGWTIHEPPADLETTGRLTLRLPKSMHKKVIDRAEEEGVSQNQLILSFIAAGLGKAEKEDPLKKDEMSGVFKAERAFTVQALTVSPYDLFYNFFPGAVSITTAATGTAFGIEMVGEVKDILGMAKPMATGAFEENYKGGYANEA